MYSYLSTSRGDGNLVPQTRGSPICLSIDTYLPREGPETFYQMYLCHQCCSYSYLSASRGDGNPLDFCSTVDSFRIDTYQPREGLETIRIKVLPPKKFLVYLPIYLERGRKRASNYVYRLLLYSYLSTSRGAGNCGVYSECSAHEIWSGIRTYLPREGPETNHHTCFR